MASKKESVEVAKTINVGVGELAGAIAEATKTAIEAARPQKKNEFTRKVNTPWTPKNGSPKAKFKRKMFCHGMPINPAFHSNEEIEALNQVRYGVFGDGWFKVVKRRDKGLDIQYPVRTPEQRQRLVTKFGLRNFTEVCQFLAAEARAPKKVEDVDEDF